MRRMDVANNRYSELNIHQSQSGRLVTNVKWGRCFKSFWLQIPVPIIMWLSWARGNRRICRAESDLPRLNTCLAMAIFRWWHGPYCRWYPISNISQTNTCLSKITEWHVWQMILDAFQHDIVRKILLLKTSAHHFLEFYTFVYAGISGELHCSSADGNWPQGKHYVLYNLLVADIHQHIQSYFVMWCYKRVLFNFKVPIGRQLYNLTLQVNP